jgi:transposase InsO family protein
LERVSDATLGTDRGSGFFHYRGVDCQRSETLSGLVLPGSVHPKSGDRGHSLPGEWTLDDSDRQKRYGRGRRDSEWKPYLIHDRDPLFTTEFQCILASIGVNAIKLPPQSPNLNAYAERFVRSIKESCLERLILCGEASLRRAIQNFIPHYHEERNHQGKGNQLLFPRGVIPVSPHDGIVQCQQRIGGLLKYYHREAA